MKGDIYGEEVHMVVDTGSTICMISLMVWNRVKRNGMTLRTTTAKLWTVDGSVARSYGRRIIPLTIGGVTKKQMVEVTDCQDEFVLGMNYMREHVSGLDFKRLRMHFGAREVKLMMINLPESETKTNTPEAPEGELASCRMQPLMSDRQEEQRRRAVGGRTRGEDMSHDENESSGAETDSGSDED